MTEDRSQAGEMAFAIMAFWLCNKFLPMLQHNAVINGHQGLSSRAHLSKYSR